MEIGAPPLESLSTGRVSICSKIFFDALIHPEDLKAFGFPCIARFSFREVFW